MVKLKNIYGEPRMYEDKKTGTVYNWTNSSTVDVPDYVADALTFSKGMFEIVKEETDGSVQVHTKRNVKNRKVSK